MISRSIDGEITARIAQAFGAKPIRASGGREPLTHVRFYARLTELGARKFRDGRKGPMMYVME